MRGVGMPDKELDEARRDFVAAVHDARELAKGVGSSIWRNFLMDMGAAYELEARGGLARNSLKSAPPKWQRFTVATGTRKRGCASSRRARDDHDRQHRLEGLPNVGEPAAGECAVPRQRPGTGGGLNANYAELCRQRSVRQRQPAGHPGRRGVRT